MVTKLLFHQSTGFSWEVIQRRNRRRLGVRH
jgi:hypothetical protein